MALNFKKIFVWHMNNARWERAMDTVYDISNSFMATHQRFLNKLHNKNTNRFRLFKNGRISKED